MSSSPVIQIENLGKRYEIYSKPQDRLRQTFWRGKRRFYQEFWALRNISLEVQKGEVVGVIGANGSGKSTLLQLVTGTLTPTVGRVQVQGRLAALLELGSGFDPQFTGRENIFLNGAILGISRQEMEQRFQEITEFADIGDFIDRPVKIYSAGMVMRLAFSVATCVRPEILIIDEVLAVGDAFFHFKCIDRLEQLLQSGMTLLLASHDIVMIKKFCDRVLYLRNGQAEALGTPEKVVELYALDFRNKQAIKLDGSSAVFTPKALVGGAEGSAFGTEEGRIVNTRFAKSGKPHAVFTAGDKIEFMVEAEFLPFLLGPCLSMIVQDKRKISLGGRTFPIFKKKAENGWCHTRLDCVFPAGFSPGRYFITLRLENRQSERIFIPIDKQAWALSFDVMPHATNDFIGPVDLEINFAS